MAIQKYSFPMTSGILTADGRSFLGLAFRDEACAFTLYDIEANEITAPLEFLDAAYWKDVEGLGYPGGVSDTGALFVSRFRMKKGKKKDVIVGMQLCAYDKDDFSLRAVIPLLGDNPEWAGERRLLTAAALAGDRYLYVYEDRSDDETLFVCSYDAKNEDTRLLFRLVEPDSVFRSVTYDPETRILEFRILSDLEDNLLMPESYEICRYEVHPDLPEARLLHRGKIDSEELTELPEDLFRIEKKPLGFLKGSLLQIYDVASGDLLLEEKANLNTVHEYLYIPALETALIQRQALVNSDAVIYVFTKQDGAFQKAAKVLTDDSAKVTWDTARRTVLVVGREATTLLHL